MRAPRPNAHGVTIQGGVHAAQPQDSAHKHVSGEAIYVDDIREPPGTLQIYIAMSERAHAVVKRLDVTKVRAAAGVVLVATANRDWP